MVVKMMTLTSLGTYLSFNNRLCKANKLTVQFISFLEVHQASSVQFMSDALYTPLYTYANLTALLKLM